MAVRHRSMRLALALGLGVALAGSLATRQLTLLALGGAAVVGAVAALYGRSSRARILGWVFAAVMAQLFVFTIGVAAGFAPAWSAFGVLAVGLACVPLRKASLRAA